MPSTIDADKPLASLVEENPERARLFESRNLDFCCGGDQTLAEACEDHGLDLDEIRDAIADVDNRNPASSDEQFDSLTDLVDYIIDHHHDYLRSELAPLSELIGKVEGAHGDNHPELHEVAEVFEQLSREIPVHLSEEEQILFPIVRQLEDDDASGLEAETASQLLEGLEDDHDGTAEHLEQIRDLTDGFNVPEDACPSYQNMLERLEELERDLHMHVHRENNVLFEKVRERVES